MSFGLFFLFVIGYYMARKIERLEDEKFDREYDKAHPEDKDDFTNI